MIRHVFLGVDLYCTDLALHNLSQPQVRELDALQIDHDLSVRRVEL